MQTLGTLEQTLTNALDLRRRPVAISFADAAPAGTPRLQGTLTLSLMAGIGYIKMTEVPAIPRLPQPPKVIVYAPLADAPVAPDVVVLSGRPSKLMLLHEAAGQAGVNTTPLLGRPTCMAVPAARSGGVASSLGCIGNRVYTDVADDEFYSVIAGADLDGVAEALATIVSANQTLAAYHGERRAALASA